MEWRNVEIEGFQGIYEVSDTGIVRSLDRMVIQKGRKARHYPSRIKAQQTDKHGYKYVTFHRKAIGVKKHFFVHRLVALAFIENPEDKPQVNHKDGDPANNNLSNLEWATNRENALHAISTGLITKEELDRKGEAIGGWAKANKSKRVAKMQNGEIVQVYEIMNDILREGIHPSIAQISQCCNNKLSSAYGYQWRFI